MRGKVVKYSSVTPSVDLAARGYAGGPPTLRVFFFVIYPYISNPVFIISSKYTSDSVNMQQ